ncbi:ATP-binding protein [Hydrogenivirga sp. 128-5-R1-1]|uniref:ATP-binding protein n=1 Tax=Hydrogenivirga sp. 128-5-R1-1 TaxID=392423 RepID=UPI00015F06DA|nr:ATP-binding protein [Hydrogenivirga sp. 128-5-R1-1]EDP73896.1 hypothetical protein HG1285_11987 [Hydrogenivirga sp. 128-5-R1-1]
MSENFYISGRNKVVKEILEGFLDTKFFGAIYGKSLTGKTFFVKNFLDNQYINYYYIDLLNQNLIAELNDLVVDEYTVLIIDNAQLLTEEEFKNVLDTYNQYKNLSIILIGNEELKNKIIKGELKKFINAFNFILEWKELDFKEFKKFLKDYMSEKNISITFTKGALKDFYKKSEGKIGKIVYLLYKYRNKKFLYKFNKSLFLGISLGILFLIGYFYIQELKNNKNEPNIGNIEKNKEKIVKNVQKNEIKYSYLYDKKNKECYNFLDNYYLIKWFEGNKENFNKKLPSSKYVYFVYLGVFKNKNNAVRMYKKIKENTNTSQK